MEDKSTPDGEIKLIGVGKVVPNKGFDRLARIHKRLREEDGLPVHTYILGEGFQRKGLEAMGRGKRTFRHLYVPGLSDQSL